MDSSGKRTRGRDAEHVLDANRDQNDEQRDDKPVEHRLRAGLAEGFKVGVEADGSQRRDHEELADGLERRGEICRNEAKARKAGHGQEAEDEPREDGLHVDLHARAPALCLLALEPQADGGKDEDGRDDGEGYRELDRPR